MCDCKCKKSVESSVAPTLRETIRIIALHDERIYEDIMTVSKLRDTDLVNYITSIKDELINKKFNDMYTKFMYDDLGRRILPKLAK